MDPVTLALANNYTDQRILEGGGAGGVAGVSSFKGRTGAVVPATEDYTPEMVGADPAGSASSALSAAKAYISEELAGKADIDLSNVSDPANALYNIGATGNRNLLDNWYFADPIDQRDGYVVPPETQAYLDSALTSAGNKTTSYCVVIERTETYTKFQVANGDLYFASPDAAVRGYAGNGYGIDRWAGNNTSTAVLVEDGHITLTHRGEVYTNIPRIYQKAHIPNAAGQSWTFSIIVRGGKGNIAIYDADASFEAPTQNAVAQFPGSESWQVVSVTARLTSDYILVRISGEDVSDVLHSKSSKLEPGDTQTLARQDEDGNWVLNDPPPNTALELAKCQRSFISAGTQTTAVGNVNAAGSILVVDIPIPVTMRGRPTIKWTQTTSQSNVRAYDGTVFFIDTSSITVAQITPNKITLFVPADGLVPRSTATALLYGLDFDADI